MKLKQRAIKLLLYAMRKEKNFSPLKGLAHERGGNFDLPLGVVFAVGKIRELRKDFEFLHEEHL